MSFLTFVAGADAVLLAGDDSPMKDEMWIEVSPSVRGVPKRLLKDQKPPEGLGVKCDGDGKASVWSIFGAAYPGLKTTPGGRPAITTREFAIIHNTIQKDLVRTMFGNLSRNVRCATAHYDATVKHDTPRDAFAMMVMGSDTYKKFMNTRNRWKATAHARLRAAPPGYHAPTLAGDLRKHVRTSELRDTHQTPP